MTTFGENLFSERKKRGLSQEDLALEVNSTKSTISKYERGHIEPTIGTVLKIANYFNLSIDYLAGNSQMPAETPENYESIISIAKANNITPNQLNEALNLLLKLKN